MQRTRSFLLAAIFATLFAPMAYASCEEEVGYVASFKVKAGSEAAFEEAVIELAATVNAVEEGVLLYAPYKGTEGRYYMMERYSSEAARTAHGKAPEVAALFPAIGPHLAGAPDIQPVSAVCGSSDAPKAPRLAE